MIVSPTSPFARLAFSQRISANLFFSSTTVGDTPGYWSETGAQPTGPAVVAYGHILSEQLAAYSSEAAMFNAENYRQYVEFLYQADTTGKVQEADGSIHYAEPPAWTTIWKGHMR